MNEIKHVIPCPPGWVLWHSWLEDDGTAGASGNDIVAWVVIDDDDGLYPAVSSVYDEPFAQAEPAGSQPQYIQPPGTSPPTLRHDGVFVFADDRHRFIESSEPKDTE